MKIKFIILISIFFILLLSLILTNFFISFEKEVFDKQSILLKEKMINEEKNNIKNDIYNIISILDYNSKKFIKMQKDNIKMQTLNSIQYIDNIYKNNINLSKEKILDIIKLYIRNVNSQNKDRYFFIYDMNGTCIYLPMKKDFEGQNLIDLRDIKGQYVVKKAIEISLKGGGFNKWYYINPKSNHIEEKIGYLKMHKELGIFIGTGMYKTDIINDSKKYLQDILLSYKTNNNGYIFAYDDKGNTLAHIKKELINKNRWNFKKNDRFLIQDIIKIGKQKDGGFIFYEATVNPKTNKSAKKISFVKEFKEFNWILGTGFYNDEIIKTINKNEKKLYKKLKKDLNDIVIVIFIVTLILIIFLWMIISRLTLKVSIFEHELEIKNQKLNDLNENLESKVKEEVEKNRQKECKLFEQSKMAAMGEMIGNIAHQWRQPLSVISIGATGLQMQKENGVLTDEYMYKTCESINSNAQYLSKTIDDFKNYIKGDRVFKLFNLSKNIDDFMKLVLGSIKNNNIEIVLNLDDNINLNGYPNELIQCYINIFNNAKDAMKSMKNKRLLFINTYFKDNKAYIIFKDNAGGIDKEIKSKIFDPYFTTKHQSQGTGLGLSMTYKLITEGMSGNIEVENDEYIYNDNKFIGAKFTIILPFKDVE